MKFPDGLLRRLIIGSLNGKTELPAAGQCTILPPSADLRIGGVRPWPIFGLSR